MDDEQHLDELARCYVQAAVDALLVAEAKCSHSLEFREDAHIGFPMCSPLPGCRTVPEASDHERALSLSDLEAAP